MRDRLICLRQSPDLGLGAFGLAAVSPSKRLGRESERNKEKTSSCFMTKVCADDACTAEAVVSGLKAHAAPWRLCMRIFSFAFIIPSATLVEMNWGPANFNLHGVHRGFGRGGAKAVEFGAVAKPAAPAAGEWGRTTVDGSSPLKCRPQIYRLSPEADRHTLIRRLTCSASLPHRRRWQRWSSLWGIRNPMPTNVWSIGYWQSRVWRALGPALVGCRAF